MLINVKMPTIVGILTFMSRINFMLSWVEHEKSFITSRLDLVTNEQQSCRPEGTSLQPDQPPLSSDGWHLSNTNLSDLCIVGTVTFLFTKCITKWFARLVNSILYNCINCHHHMSTECFWPCAKLKKMFWMEKNIISLSLNIIMHNHCYGLAIKGGLVFPQTDYL